MESNFMKGSECLTEDKAGRNFPSPVTDYELTFPGAPEGRASLVHLKRLLLVGLSHYLYKRKVFSRSTYKQRFIEESKYMVIKNSSGNGKLFLRYMNSIGEALNRRCLKKVIVSLCPRNSLLGAKAVETFNFAVRYALPSSNVVIFNVNGDPVNTINYNGSDSSREQVLHILRSIDQFTKKPLNVTVKCHPVICLELFDDEVELISKNYIPLGFVAAPYISGISSDSDSNVTCFGAANFQQHACKIAICQKSKDDP